ncbi:hypothetical protein J2Z31_003510 [Sinorhizobium kostiense]|uniref:Transposase n=1 Tax=Sinorhizobium kostiense TaxID=76747 RepID=A0ABS4R3M5_9HYPH|nr:hypothetical protein [Sinorhizobium kostiense]
MVMPQVEMGQGHLHRPANASRQELEVAIECLFK